MTFAARARDTLATPLRPRLVALCAVTLVALSAPAASQSPPAVVVLKGASLIDGTSAGPVPGVTVVIRDGRIQRVSRDAVRVPAGARVIDLGGRWLLPGLIDAHVHLRDIASARAALRSGVTTARSLGGPAFADVDIRRRHQAGAFDLPDVIAAGYHVRRRMAPEFFRDAPELSPMADGLRGPDDVRHAVRALLERGADVIKVMATERAGLLETDFLARVLADDEIAAAVAEAARVGVTVAAHAHTDEGARAALLAGARTIEHGTLVSGLTLGLMKRRGACLVPTISFWRDMADPGGEYDDPRLSARAEQMLPRVQAAAALAWNAGVAIAAGSDMRYDTSSTYGLTDEIAALAGAGIPIIDAVRAATSAAADCLGIGDRTGAIEPGLEADMIVVAGDPLADVRALRHPVMVINNGRVVIDHLARTAR